MAMNTVINTNMRALTAHRNLSTVGARQNKANQRLSSGKKINSAADDAAGLAISEKMKAQIKGLDMASKNSEDAISLIQTAEGSLTEVNNMLTRVRELTVQAANDTNQQEDRVKIAEEVASLLTEIDSISSRTEFNEKKLNDGSFQNGFFQIGANAGQKLDLGIGNMSVFGIGMDEIMETFGVEKKVELNTTSSQVGVVADGVQSSSKITIANATLTGNNNDAKLSTATVTFKYTENGEAKELNLKVDLSSVKVDGANKNQFNAADIANALADQLNKNTDVNGKFEFSSNGGDLTIKTIDNGGEIVFGTTVNDFKITYDNATGTTAAGTVGAGQAGAGTTATGYHNRIDFKNLAEGETITIAGKTFTKVAADKVGEKANSFSTIDELQNLLANEGITSSQKNAAGAAAGTDILQLDTVDHQNSGLSGTYSVSSKDVSDQGKDFSKLLDNIDESLKAVTTQRSKLGANQNRLEYTINNLNITSENLSAAKSRIEDTDMAKEMMNLTSANVLQQAATSMLAQANQAPQSITQLLG